MENSSEASSYIIGRSSGMGFATARLLAEQGSSAVIVARYAVRCLCAAEPFSIPSAEPTWAEIPRGH